jgi:hypothetical protein
VVVVIAGARWYGRLRSEGCCSNCEGGSRSELLAGVDVLVRKDTKARGVVSDSGVRCSAGENRVQVQQVTSQDPQSSLVCYF